MLEIRYVEWVDSAGIDRWMTLKELREEKPSICRSVGYVLIDNEESLSLLQSLDLSTDEDHLSTGRGHLVIPKVAIRKQETLRSGE